MTTGRYGRWSRVLFCQASITAARSTPYGIDVATSVTYIVQSVDVHRNEEASLPGHILRKIKEEIDGSI